jgi:hypothetical protein
MLKIFFDGTNISREQARYEYQTSSVVFDTVDKLEVGFDKPLSSLYLNFTNNSATRTLSVEYYNGSSWVSVAGLTDLTFGLTIPGFVTWNKNQTTETATTLNGESMYWYRFNLSASATIAFKGIGVLFSDDYDLKGEFPTILDHLPEGKTSFVTFHESARKSIVTDLRRAGFKVQAEGATKPSQLTEYDILDKEEVREASKYLALSKIFNWLSDSPGDNFDTLADGFKADAAGAITPLISIDTDDDGLEDDEEVADTTPVIVGRL